MEPSRKTSRREFLSGQSATRAVTDWLDQGVVGDAVDVDWDDVAEPYLLHFSRRAMACDFELALNAGQHADAAAQAMAALDLVDELEDQMTVYREHSELMDINRRAAYGPVQVEPRLFGLFELCLELYQETDGAFDITAGPLSKVWGFYRRQGEMPTQEAVDEALAKLGSDKIELDPARSTIRFTVAGMELNLGSIGKGYALDRCAERLLAAGIDDYFFHGGRSSVLARGSRSFAEGDERGWSVGVADPLRPGKRLGFLRLRDRGLGTSGSLTQFFRYQGRRYGHILDPRTGWPAEDVYSVTVLAPTAAQADALATAFYVMGPQPALEYCRDHREVAVFIVCGNPDRGTTEVKTAGFAEGELTMVSVP